MTHRIIPRPEWGARHRGGFYDREASDLEVWLHHSVTIAPDLVPPFDDDYAAMRTLEGIGQSRFGGGISYTHAITPAGLIFEGHGVGRVGAHTAGHNRRGAGIVLVGNYDRQDPPQPMLDALVWLLQEYQRRGWSKAARLNGGHRDTKATACPGGRAYPLIATINARASTPAPAPGPAPVPTPAPAPAPAPNRDLKIGSTGPRVRALQAHLKAHYPLYAKHLVVDGEYGPKTAAVVREFQRRAKLVVDGIAGPATHQALTLPF